MSRLPDNVFAGAHFDRLGYRRRDEAWLRRALADPESAYVAVWHNRNLIGGGAHAEAVFLKRGQLPPPAAPPVLLGEYGGRACFAVDLGVGDEAPLTGLGEFRTLRTVGLLAPVDQSALLAYAQAMVLWHRRQRHCSVCGAPTRSEEAGHVRRCTDTACAHGFFPRIEPAIIVLVEHDDSALLGRQPSWPAGVYSTIAGFVEPGESLEDAVRREVDEETGVTVAEVQYRSSQPWPFPASLMLGFRARAASTHITLRDAELEDARWFSREELEHGYRSGKFRVPPAVSISHRLIAEWFDSRAPGRLAELAERYPAK